MQDTTTIKYMTPEHKALLLRLTDIALQWAAGRITYDEVMQRIGKPAYHSEQLGFITDFYYVSDAMRYEFAHQLFEGNPRIYNFELDLNSDVRVNIPYQWFDSLGLPRLVRDESIDGIRREEADFFVPVGALDITGWYGLNYVSFGYRMPLPPDSLFDVILGTSYNAEWIDANDEKVLGNIRKAENLRGLGVSRRYLTPRELEQRREATWRND